MEFTQDDLRRLIVAVTEFEAALAIPGPEKSYPREYSRQQFKTLLDKLEELENKRGSRGSQVILREVTE